MCLPPSFLSSLLLVDTDGEFDAVPDDIAFGVSKFKHQINIPCVRCPQLEGVCSRFRILDDSWCVCIELVAKRFKPRAIHASQRPRPPLAFAKLNDDQSARRHVPCLPIIVAIEREDLIGQPELGQFVIH